MGGSFLLVPRLAFLGVPMKIAVGTDLIQIMASTSVGTATYYPDGYVDLAIGSFLMVGSIIGTFIGTGLNKKLLVSALKKNFGILMLFVGVLMISKAVL
ncbi:sulfite exporter TauE/SafE [archaeon]|nr:sulfite exporter TauE/SafE [archaeon]